MDVARHGDKNIQLACGLKERRMRFKELERNDLSDDQRRIIDEIREGPRGKNNPSKDRSLPRGLFGVMIRAPGLADTAQKVGAYLRYGSSLNMRISEFAIIITARYWRSEPGWNAHCSLALQAGLAQQTAEDLSRGREPSGMQKDEAVAWRYCRELHDTKAVSDDTFKAALDEFGEQGVVDLTGVAGYYTLASMMQNIAAFRPAPGVPVPLYPLNN
jgi:4-carboxymuconolactone decarboxylase